MFINYLLLAWRNFRKDPLYAVINLGGFTLGLTVCILIILYVADELSYDKHHKYADRIFRIEQDMLRGEKVNTWIRLNSKVGGELKARFHEVQASSQLSAFTIDISHREEIYNVKACRLSPEGLDIFTFPLLEGDTKTAFDEPNEVIISETYAKKLFQDERPLGKQIIRIQPNGESKNFKIGGVMKDIPRQSHFQADILMMRQERGAGFELDFSGPASLVSQYILLSPGVESQEVIRKFEAIASDYNFPKTSKLRLRPLSSIHLHSHTENEFEANGSIVYVRTFSIAAALILILVCINFINLLTARSLRRAKEIGVRKTLGAARRQVSLQFFVESFAYIFIAFSLGLILAIYLLPFFGEMVAKDLSPQSLISPIGLWLFGIVILTGFISGFYPALYLSAFRPVFALREAVKGSLRERYIRRSLTVFQFSISIALIICTLVIFHQLEYVSSKRLGYRTENIIQLPKHTFAPESSDGFEQKLEEIPGVLHTSLVSWSPGEPTGAATTCFDSSRREYIKIQFIDSDKGLAETLGLELAEGRFFSENDKPVNRSGMIRFDDDGNVLPPEDELNGAIILNETAIEMMGIEAEIDQQVQTNKVWGRLVGIVKDFHERSLHHEIGPLVIRHTVPRQTHTLVNIQGTNLDRTIERIEEVWQENIPGQVFDFEFIDEKLAQLYLQEKQLGKLFLAFAILAIVIANLGLLGMISLIAVQRTKEIGIRKVLGASIKQIVKLLSREFIVLVMVSIVIAIPITWYLMEQWLQNFAYRVEIQWWIFVLAGMGAILIAFLTVSTQSIRAASVNPVESLKDE